MIADTNPNNGRKPITCPVCGGTFFPSDVTTMPFCSERCQKIDLGRWLGEDYGLPIEGQEGSDPFTDDLE